jgi:hypothetical protein
MVSGQSPNPATQTDCQIYFDFVSTGLLDTNGQAIGQGCVYPSSVMTLSNQLESAGRAWRGYMEDMGNDLARDGSATCAHPALNGRDMTQTAEAADQYAARHDPFVYFHSIIDNNANCSAHVVPLTLLATDLASLNTTPEFVFITPNLCHDGHDAPCANGEPGGLVSADNFLAQTVPAILNSPAYNRDGLLAIIFDEAATSDASSCCNEQSGPNTVLPGITGPGGGRTGAVLLSKYIAPGTVSSLSYNHYALLRTIEDAFGQSRLGFACQSGLAPFGSDVFTHRTAN